MDFLKSLILMLDTAFTVFNGLEGISFFVKVQSTQVTAQKKPS